MQLRARGGTGRPATEQARSLTVPDDAALRFRRPRTAVAAGDDLATGERLRSEVHKRAARENLLESAPEPVTTRNTDSETQARYFDRFELS
jgi:hypothetical protein